MDGSGFNSSEKVYHMLVLVFPYILLSASVRFWPKAEAQVAFSSVSFGEIAWLFREKFLNFGFCSIHQQ